MNIGIDGRMLGNRHGGIGRYVLELTRHILAIDNNNQYVLFISPKTVDQSDLQELKQFSNLTIIPVNARHYSLAEQITFLKILNRCNLDLVHFPNFNVPLFYKKPFVVTIHDLVHHKISGAKKSHFFHFLAYKKIIQSAATRARAIITVSEYSKRDIAKILGQPLEKIIVTYEGLSLKDEVTEQQLADVRRKFLLDRPYFLFVGVLERKKNIVNLTRGFDIFIKKFGLNMDLVIAGKADKHYPEIKHQAMDIKSQDRLVFTGYIDDADLAGLYKGAYAFVSASLHEGFGLPGAEAMSFGLPLAVSNIAVFNEIYDNAAVYFNPLDPNDIAEKLRLLASDTDFYRQTQSKSLARSALFDWAKTAQETINVYQAANLAVPNGVRDPSSDSGRQNTAL